MSSTARDVEAMVGQLDREIEFNGRLLVLVNDMLRAQEQYVPVESLHQRKANLIVTRNDLHQRRVLVMLILDSKRDKQPIAKA